MAEFPALPLWTDAYMADCNHLTDAEHGRYLQLLILMWRAPKQRLPNNDEWLARKFRRPVEAVKAEIRPLIEEFCDTDGNWITQKRLLHEHNYVTKKSDKQRARAKSRWQKKKHPSRGSTTPGIAPTPTPTPTPIKEISPSGDTKKDAVFEEFWVGFPRQRRGAKQKAYSAWKQALQRASSAEIIAGLRDYADSDEVRRGFAKGAEAWLNDDRWANDYRTFRKKTAEEEREEFVHGDERDGLGGDTIDGECLEVPEREPEGHGGGVPPGAAGSGRRGNRKGGPVAIGELVEGLAAQAGGHQDSGGGGQVTADSGQAPAASGADARGDHGEDSAGHIPRPGNHGSLGGGAEARASPPLAAGGVESHQQAAGGSAAAAWPTPIDLTPPAWMDKRSRK